jgi:hypothetical protein
MLIAKFGATLHVVRNDVVDEEVVHD